MVIGQIWLNANPELRNHLRAVNEERSAAFYAAWSTVTAAVRRFIEAVRRVRRERAAYGPLSRLNDRQLKDIGISRSEIGGIARAIAEAPLRYGQTVAELRQLRHTAPLDRKAGVTPPARTGPRRSRAGIRAVPQPATAAPAEAGRAA